MSGAARYHPSREQLTLAEEFTSSLDRLLPLSRLHTSLEESDDTWNELNDMGLFSVTLGEEFSGSGLGVTEEALIAIALGRRLAAPAVMASMGAASAAEFPTRPFDPNHSRVAAAYRRGDRIVKIHETRARLLLLRNEDHAVLVESGSASQPLDQQLWLADIHAVTTVGKTIAVFRDEQMLRLRLLDAAILVGIAEAAVAMAVAYAAIRKQFGRPIGSFQAVQHHCANMAMAARRARDQTNFAAIAFDDRRKDARLQVECAFLEAGTAAMQTTALNIQIHGAIGFSDDADPHLLLKRAQLHVSIGGGLEAACSRVAAIEPAL